jgi:hypothetical protein
MEASERAADVKESKELTEMAKKSLNLSGSISDSELITKADSLADELMKHIESEKITKKIPDSSGAKSIDIQVYVIKNNPASSYGSGAYRYYKEDNAKEIFNGKMNCRCDLELEEKAIQEDLKEGEQIAEELEKDKSKVEANIAKLNEENGDDFNQEATQKWFEAGEKLEEIEEKIRVNNDKLEQTKKDKGALEIEKKIKINDLNANKIKSVIGGIKEGLKAAAKDSKLTPEQIEKFISRFKLHFEGGTNIMSAMDKINDEPSKPTGSVGNENKPKASTNIDISEILADAENEQKWRLTKVKDGSYAYCNDAGRPFLVKTGTGILEPLKISENGLKSAPRTITRKQNELVKSADGEKLSRTMDIFILLNQHRPKGEEVAPEVNDKGNNKVNSEGSSGGTEKIILRKSVNQDLESKIQEQEKRVMELREDIKSLQQSFAALNNKEVFRKEDERSLLNMATQLRNIQNKHTRGLPSESILKNDAQTIDDCSVKIKEYAKKLQEFQNWESHKAKIGSKLQEYKERAEQAINGGQLSNEQVSKLNEYGAKLEQTINDEQLSIKQEESALQEYENKLQEILQTKNLPPIE